MKKRELQKKFISSALVLVLALTGMNTKPQTITAADPYFRSPWRAEGTVSVHDPSIITTEDAEGKTVYYIFGSHLAFAKSYDLKKWEPFENNISKDYDNLFKVGAEWSKLGKPGYALVPPREATNIWAPDVIWNEDMKKWCMYMTINGNSWNSSICLLTADSLDGDWTYVDTIIYSGFTNKEYNHDYTLTDYQKVTGDKKLADRYIGRPYTPAPGCAQTTWNISYGAHAIDPCVRYDEDGRLWMSYGSWSGGIYMIELDKTTGLRDLTHKYETVENKSDTYMGIQLAGGKAVSGEAPYIRKIGDYYYLFVSYGGLTATGGYNVRVFRSKEITGPYEDSRGTSAIFSNAANNIQGRVGNRLMAYYQWSWSNFGEIAQGHNSALVDKDGKAYIVYHTRSTNYGEEHKVRTHQLFQNENGWLVESPFMYDGETINKEGYSTEEIVGTYEIIFHEATAIGSKEPNTGIDIALNSDGTVTCATDKNMNGTWRETQGSYYMELNIAETAFHGVFTTGTIEGTGDKTLCFTALADQNGPTGYNGIYVWGVRLSDDLTDYIESNLELQKSKLSIEKGSSKKIKVMSTASDSKFLKKAVWKSSKPGIATVNANGNIKAKKIGKTVITATVNGKSMTCNVTVTKKTTKKAKK